MTISVSYPHIEKPSGESSRLQRLPRIRVAQIVMDYVGNGWSADEILRQHPQLLPTEVHSAMAYYFDHRSEIEEEIRAEVAACEASRAMHTTSAIALRLLASRTP